MKRNTKLIPLLLAGIICLLLGGAGGLARIGIVIPFTGMRLITQHGVILVLGFLGTLISLERAVALGRRWALLAPVLCAAGALILISGLPLLLSGILFTAGMCALVAVFVVIFRIQPSLPGFMLLWSAVCAAGGAIIWTLGIAAPGYVPFLAGFLILAIAAERVEMSRVTGVRGSDTVPMVVATTATVAGIAVAFWNAAGDWLAGFGLIVMVVWLLRHEVIRRTVRKAGLPRFSAVGLLCGYASLVAAAGAVVFDPGFVSGKFADIAIHGVFLGFAMSMVMVHAPVIVPAVLRIPLHFSKHAYGPLILLQISLLMRYSGDVFGSHLLIVCGGAGSAVALVCFVASTAWMARQGVRGAGRSQVRFNSLPAGIMNA